MRFVDPDVEQFTETFKKIKSSINKKEINKAVPAVFSIAAGSMTKAMRAYFIRQTLMNANKQTAYGYLTPTEGVIGASPEILFTYDIRSYELVTMALAGTRNSKLEGEHSLSNDEKEMYEHGLVVSGLKKKLVNFGELQISPTYVWDLGTISHLRTDLLAELDKPLEPISLFAEACSLLHPTAALGVSPITSDWRYMKECDGQIKRARFGAPFGVVSPTGKSVALVAIRNLQWSEDGTISIGTGCGIVQDSNLQSEWQELTLKRDSIRKILGL
ncbi:MAG: hypothetical protein A2Z20_08310 [Bdellovibrionales bacterium RBG_16_40_8]|nr:MAG: hypothetical protein A2Z20_08310 [Bdellovibrionales bacterium RBG_16_40_8]